MPSFTQQNNFAALLADGVATPPGSDGGIDVVSRDAIAQVKMEGVAAGRPVVPALVGVATIEGQKPLSARSLAIRPLALE